MGFNFNHVQLTDQKGFPGWKTKGRTCKYTLRLHMKIFADIHFYVGRCIQYTYATCTFTLESMQLHMHNIDARGYSCSQWGGCKPMLKWDPVFTLFRVTCICWSLKKLFDVFVSGTTGLFH